jgi:hypothetical protein
MTPTIELQLLLATLSGWAGLRQARAISYLIEENRVLKEQVEVSARLGGLLNYYHRRAA